VVSTTPTQLFVHLQRPDGTFATRTRAITENWSVAVGDADADGDADIYLQRGCGRTPPPPGGGDDAPDQFLLNDGTGRAYAALATPDLAQGCADAVTPIRRRGRTWFLVTNGFAQSPGPIQLLAVRPQTAAAAAPYLRNAATSQPAVVAPAR